MTSLPNTLSRPSEMAEMAKNKRIQALLAFFYDFNKKADAEAKQRQRLNEACYRRSATEAAENIFELLGMTNGKETFPRNSVDRSPGQRTDGLELVNDL